MKIELTEDEVKIIGQERNFKPPQWYAWSLILGVVLAVLPFPFLPKGRSWWELLILPGLAIMLIPFYFMMKRKSAAGRRFLEEQKHLAEMEAWEKPGVKSNPDFKEV